MSLIEQLLKKDVLISPEQLQELTDEQKTQLENKIETLTEEEIYAFLEQGTVEVLRSYTKKPTKRTVQHFVGHFTRRLETIGDILRTRSELSSPTSIAHIKPGNQAVIIGLIWEKRETKNGHIILEVEDKTGKINVLLSKNKPEFEELAKDLMQDEIIGVVGQAGENIVFANEIFIPDVPASNELKKSPTEAYSLFISDLHCGNKDFYKKEFLNMIAWLQGDVGSPAQQAIAKKVKYLFIVGDMVEGVGIYPGQEDDLEFIDVKEQYQEFSKYIQLIPSRIQIIMCPGNHEAGRLAEPQFNLYQDFTEDIFTLPNVHFVSNPSYVRIHRTNTFAGFTVLLYHGYSFIYYGNNVPSIFAEGGVNNPAGIMKYLLTRRHLAPTHTSNLYIPDPVEDPLVIKEIPDFFISGHTHMTAIENYRGVTMMNCSCWVPITENQRGYGLTVDAGKAIITNLQTRESKVLSFVKEGVQQ
ncbi:MAG: metallophosphoesterase [Candidatus Woesearchaeota archaeon]